MTDIVKGGRRAEQTRATKRRILAAAQDLFTRRGYAPTTLAEIAAAADVAVQTVYFHFGNKATVLKEIIDVLAVGDDEPVPLLERPEFRRYQAEPDGHRALALWLAMARAIFVRTAPMMKVVRDAAGSDQEMATQWAANQQQRLTAHRSVAGGLAAKQVLRPDVSAEQATDVIFGLVSPELYYLFTVERGWSPEDWEAWMRQSLTALLLR
jgi:AcrR family transcriptional regulator